MLLICLGVPKTGSQLVIGRAQVHFGLQRSSGGSLGGLGHLAGPLK